jgi:RES domain-containing protein
MALVYRIQKREFSQDRNAILSGLGAFLHGGRWNPNGVPLLYTSTTPELAALEYRVQLVGLPHHRIPPLSLITLQIPDSIKIIKKEALPPDWDNEFLSVETQNFNQEWIRKKETLALKIPSVVVQKSYNVLINPAHSLIKEVNIIEIEDFSFDRRLFVRTETPIMNAILKDIIGFENQ